MEVLLPNTCDVQKFVMAWVAAAGDAAGQARLELNWKHWNHRASCAV